MYEIFNTVLELAMTGLFTAAFLLLFVKVGIMPMMVLQFTNEEDEHDKKDNKEDDLPY